MGSFHVLGICGLSAHFVSSYTSDNEIRCKKRRLRGLVIVQHDMSNRTNQEQAKGEGAFDKGHDRFSTRIKTKS